MDDAGGIEFGLSGVSPAVLWVHGMDVERAREVIHVDEPAETPAESRPVRHERSPLTRGRLSKRERIVAGAGAAALVVVGLALPAGPSTQLWTVACAVLASSLTVVAWVGRAPAPVRAILRTFSGEAP